MPYKQFVEKDPDVRMVWAAGHGAISQSQTHEVNEDNADKTNIKTLQSQTPDVLKYTEDASNANILVNEDKGEDGSSNLITASQEETSKPKGSEEADESSKTLNQKKTDVDMEEGWATSEHFCDAPGLQNTEETTIIDQEGLGSKAYSKEAALVANVNEFDGEHISAMGLYSRPPNWKATFENFLSLFVCIMDRIAPICYRINPFVIKHHRCKGVH